MSKLMHLSSTSGGCKGDCDTCWETSSYSLLASGMIRCVNKATNDGKLIQYSEEVRTKVGQLSEKHIWKRFDPESQCIPHPRQMDDMASTWDQVIYFFKLSETHETSGASAIRSLPDAAKEHVESKKKYQQDHSQARPGDQVFSCSALNLRYSKQFPILQGRLVRL